MEPSRAPWARPLPAAGTFVRALVVGVAVLNLLVAGIAWYSLRLSRENYQERTAVTAENLSRILDESLTGQFAKVDLALLAVVDEAERQLATGKVRKEALDAFISREHGRLPELAALRATDAAGDAVYGPPARAATTTSLAHRDYFKHLLENPDAGLVVSKPLVGGISGKWLIILARRINRPDGAFAGLAYAGVALDQLTRSFARLDVGPNGSLALLDGDATLVARFPEVPAGGTTTGTRVASSRMDDLIRSRQSAATYLAISAVDGQERTFSVRRLGTALPFYVAVGLATVDRLEKWRGEAWQLAGFAAAFLVLSIASAALAARAWRRSEREAAERHQAQALLTAQKEALEATLARTKRLEGILSICMHCKKIHSERESWQQLEKYISENSDARFSHGICPECTREYYPALDRS